MRVDRAAMAVSTAFSAPVSSTLTSILLLQMLPHPPPSAFLDIWAGLLLLGVVPISMVLLASRLCGFDINVPNRNVRLYLLPFAVICQILAVFIFAHSGIQDMVTFSMLCLAVTVAVSLLSLRLKVSIHAAALAGSITAVVELFGVFAVPLYLLLIPVFWSRRRLGVHGIRELLVGTFVGIGFGLLVYHPSILQFGGFL